MQINDALHAYLLFLPAVKSSQAQNTYGFFFSLGKDKNSFFTVQKNSVIAYSGLINLIFL